MWYYFFMKQIYVIRKYVAADSIEEAIKKDKRTAVVDCWLTEYSTSQHLENISPKSGA